MKKSIIIIGAGVAGLSAGCYGQMNGYNTQIYEMHNLPGGVCTTWKRRGYKIDGCLHWLIGTKAGTDFYQIWEELGVMPKSTIIEHEVYAQIEGQDSKIFTVYCDTDRLEQHMKELAPEDKELIEDFTNGIRKMMDFHIPWEKASDLFRLLDKIKFMRSMIPFSGIFRKWGKKTIMDVAQQFKNQFMSKVFPYIFNLENPPDFPILAVMMTFAWMNQKTAGYPIGGSLELARIIERRYLSLGGKIHYKSKVVNILVKNDKTVGVKLADGSEHRSDIVISAADGRTTIFDMLNGKYINKKIQGYYNNLALFSPLILVGFGVNGSFKEVPSTVTGINFPLEKSIVIGKKKRDRLNAQFYTYDPTLAPEGKTFVRVHFASDYDYWKKRKQDLKRYKLEKEKIAEKVIVQLDQRFPGFAAKVEMYNVATPMTWVRYTGNWRGSFEGWIETTKTMRMRMSQMLPGLSNFYMAGQWVQPGGSIPAVAMSGRNAVQIICQKDNKEFMTMKP